MPKPEIDLQDAAPKPCPACKSEQVELLTDDPKASQTLTFRCVACHYVWHLVRRPWPEQMPNRSRPSERCPSLSSFFPELSEVSA